MTKTSNKTWIASARSFAARAAGRLCEILDPYDEPFDGKMLSLAYEANEGQEKVTVTLQHEAARFLGWACMAALNDAPNFATSTMRVNARHGEEIYELTVRRHEGETPEQSIGRLLEQVDELEQEIKVLRAENASQKRRFKWFLAQIKAGGRSI